MKKKSLLNIVTGLAVTLAVSVFTISGTINVYADEVTDGAQLTSQETAASNEEALAQYYAALEQMKAAGIDTSAVEPGAAAQGNVATQGGTTAEIPVVEAGDLSKAQKYFSKSVFVGDSVMVGFANYSQSNAGAAAHGATFLSAKSFAVYHALKDVSKDGLQPTYNGKKDNVWNLIAGMDVNRVFIYLGTNDLVGIDPETTSTKMMELAAKIKAAKPGVEIHIVSMVPCYAGTNKGYINNTSIDEYNKLLVKKAAANGYNFVDINTSLKDGTGNLVSTYSGDKFVHLNTSGYKVWDSLFASYGRVRG